MNPEQEKQFKALLTHANGLKTLIDAKVMAHASYVHLGQNKQAEEIRETLHTLVDSHLDMQAKAYKLLRDAFL